MEEDLGLGISAGKSASERLRPKLGGQKKILIYLLSSLSSSYHIVYNLSPLSKLLQGGFILESVSRNSPIIRFAHNWPQTRSLQNPTDLSVSYELRWRISSFVSILVICLL